MTKEDVLRGCTVDGNIVRLPNIQLQRDLYLNVAKSLNLIGGKWKGGKVAGFVFQGDPSDLISQISEGVKRNLKKEFQFFATPDIIADRLVSIADIGIGNRILEPSAGQGAIINAITRKHPEVADVDCYELMDINRTFLEKIPKAHVLGSDFFNLVDHVRKNPSAFKMYDRIVANPPFSKNQDIDHIYGMYDVLKVGGRMVSIASKHWEQCENKKETAFRSWLEKVGATTEDVSPGEFKSSGTGVGAVIVVITKR